MFSSLSLTLLVGILVVCAAVILACGLRMTGMADRIADRTGLGEALIGGILLGAATSLSGSVVSVTAALSDQASLAVSNGVGGIAAQTAFLAMADILYRKANLEHAAAELANVYQGALLMLLLTLPIAAYAGPDVALLGIHPVSLVLLAVYLVGVEATRRVRQHPMWHPRRTSDTMPDTPDEPESQDRNLAFLLGAFLVLMLLMGVAGWTISRVGSEISSRYGLSQTLVGVLLTAVITSLPELVTTMAAVRRGALQLAVGGIIGGNTFDTLFLTISDVAYRPGSIYHAMGTGDLFWLAVGLLMTGVLLQGLILRERAGPGRIGSESVAILAIYLGAVGIQLVL